MAHGSKAGPTSRRQLSWQSAGRDWTRQANGSCRQEGSFSWRPLSDFSAPERVCRSVSTREPPRGWTLKKTTGLGGSSVLAGIVSKADTGHGAVVAGQARQRQASRSREEGLNVLFTDQSRAEVRSVAGQRLLSSLPTRHNACRGKPSRCASRRRRGEGRSREHIWRWSSSMRSVGFATGRWTSSAIYLLEKKDILAAALQRAKPKQAMRFPTVVLAALKELVANAEAPVQCWGTVPLSHH